MKVTVALCSLAFIVGVIAGVKIDVGEKYEAGRLSACKDLVGAAELVVPPLSLVNPTCQLYKSEAVLRLNDKLFSLDGQRQLN